LAFWRTSVMSECFAINSEVIMKIKNTLIALLFLTIIGCQNQYTCGYDPDLFDYTDAFSIKSIDGLNSSLEELIDKLEIFGVDNGYCIANQSLYENNFNRFTANIRIVKENITFLIFGSESFILHFAQKESDVNKQKEINLFCDFLSKEVDVSKITYYKKEGKGKLCNFD